MFGLGFWEVIVILTIALIVFGPDKLPEIARSFGRFSGQMRRTFDEFRFEMTRPELTPGQETAEQKNLSAPGSSVEALARMPAPAAHHCETCEQTGQSGSAHITNVPNNNDPTHKP